MAGEIKVNPFDMLRRQLAVSTQRLKQLPSEELEKPLSAERLARMESSTPLERALAEIPSAGNTSGE